MLYYLCSPGNPPASKKVSGIRTFVQLARDKNWVVKDIKSGRTWLPSVSIAPIPAGMESISTSKKVFVMVADESDPNVAKVRRDEEARNRVYEESTKAASTSGAAAVAKLSAEAEKEEEVEKAEDRKDTAAEDEPEEEKDPKDTEAEDELKEEPDQLLDMVQLTKGTRPKNIFQLLTDLISKVTFIEGSMKEVKESVNAGFQGARKDMERLHTAVFSVHEVAVNAQLERWLLTTFRRSSKLPLHGQLLKYTADDGVEDLAKNCLKQDKLRTVPTMAEIDGLAFLEGSLDMPEVFVAEMTRSVNLCDKDNEYEHPIAPVCTPSSKLLYKMVQLERAISACQDAGLIVYGAAIVSPSFRRFGDADELKLATKVMESARHGLARLDRLFSKGRFRLLPS